MSIILNNNKKRLQNLKDITNIAWNDLTTKDKEHKEIIELGYKIGRDDTVIKIIELIMEHPDQKNNMLMLQTILNMMDAPLRVF